MAVRQYKSALDIVDAALADDPGQIAALILRAKTLRMARQSEEALAALDRATEVTKDHADPNIRAELAYERGFLLEDAGQLEMALDQFMEAASVGDPHVDYYSMVSNVLCRLDRDAEAVELRHKILRLRDEAVGCAPGDVIAAERPKPFDPSRPERNIVSYCLFGNDPYYHECAITNARMTPVMFPEFTARFYCAPDVPTKVLMSLRAARAEVLMAPANAGPNVSPFAGTFWRFLTFDDPDADVVLCRDVDSPILPRERAAIDMWLAGDAPFYGLRDHVNHAELILAGMWGGFTGVLPPLGPLADAHMRTDHTRFADQNFLRTQIWPRLRDHAIMSIDSFASLDNSVDFPPGHAKYGRQHVGVSWTRSQILGEG